MAQKFISDKIIRHIKTNKQMLVIHVYKHCCLVVDIEDGNGPTTIKALLQRDYYQWRADADTDCEIQLSHNPREEVELTFKKKTKEICTPLRYLQSP